MRWTRWWVHPGVQGRRVRDALARAIILAFSLAVVWLMAGCNAGAGQDPGQAAVTADTSAAEPASPAAVVESPEAGETNGAATPAASAAPAAEGDELAPGAGDEAPAVSALALAAPGRLLDSYRLAASYVVTSQLPGGAVRVAGTDVQADWLRTDGPFGFDAAFALVNWDGERRQEFSLVVIDDDAAVQTDGAWSTIRRDAALPYADPDSLLFLPYLERINQGENLGRERLEGVDVTHYRLADPQVFGEVMRELLPGEAGSVQSVLLEGWVADAGFVVKYSLHALLDDALFVDEAGASLAVQQEIDASYALRELDGVPGVEWPADAQPPETVVVPGFVPNTFPIPEGATATPRLGLLEIRTAQTESEVAAFYRLRLGELGWAVAGELGFYTAAKSGQTINLTILPDEVSGETQIRVFAPGEE